MAKTESTFLNMLVVLTVTTLIVGAALGYVYNITKKPIAEAEKKQQIEAIQMVAPEFDNSPIKDKYSLKIGADSLEVTIFPAKKGGQKVGAAVEAITKKGFGGEIKIMVGFNADGSIRNYRVLKHAETPGLGSKMDEWFRTDKNNQNILGKNPATDRLTVSKDGGSVDAITAATISSRAFLDAIQTAYNAYMNRTDAQSGASYKAHNK